MESLSIFDMLHALAGHIATLETLIKGFAYLLALILVLHCVARLYRKSEGDREVTTLSVLIEFMIAGAIASFAWSLQIVGASTWGRSTLVAYAMPADTKTASEITVATVMAAFMILRIFGYGWFIQSLLRLKALSSGRQSNYTVGGAAVQMVAAAGLVNIAWVVAIVQSTLGFKTTVLDLLKLN